MLVTPSSYTVLNGPGAGIMRRGILRAADRVWGGLSRLDRGEIQVNVNPVSRKKV